VVSLINMKGGVGKTTAAVGLAWELASAHRVLLVDIDPQFNATQWLVPPDDYLKWIKDPSKRTVYDVYLPDPGAVGVSGQKAKKRAPATLSNAVITVAHGATSLDIVPSTIELIRLDAAPRGTENRLKLFLAEARKKYEIILLDCPPTASLFSYSAYLASDGYVVPIKPDPLSVLGLPLLDWAISEYHDRSGHDAKLLGLLLTLVRGTSAMAQTSSRLKGERKGQVLATSFPLTTGVAEAVDAFQPLQVFHKTKNALRPMLAQYAQEFMQRFQTL